MGGALTDWTTQDFRERMAERLREHSPAPASAQDQVVRMLDFAPADATDPADVRRVIGEDGPSTLVYLALPPALLESALEVLATAGLRADDAVAIEKPFGTDLASARRLNEIMRTRLPFPMIFRVDHFLSDELVRRVVSLRFLNRVFAPAWDTQSIERVDISWLEDLTLEGRASYYDGAGAMKDMLQNHLMEVLSLWWPMEQPARLDADSFRGGSGRGASRRRHPLRESGCSRATVRARYTAGTIGARKVPSYVDEPGVDPSRDTETYAALTLRPQQRHDGRGSRFQSVPGRLWARPSRKSPCTSASCRRI